MKILSQTEDTLTLLMDGDEYDLLTRIASLNWIDEYVLKKLTGETIASIELLIEKIKHSCKKHPNRIRPSRSKFEVSLSKHDLWAIQHAVLLNQESLELPEFQTMTGVEWEEGKAFLAAVDLILKNCDFNKEAHGQFRYPISLVEQADLGNMYVHFFLARTEINLELISSLIDYDRIMYSMYHLFDFSTYEDLYAYDVFMEKYHESNEHTFILRSSMDLIAIYIYPDTIVFASYQKPWETRLAPEPERSHRFETFEILSKKAERIIMGFKEDESIYTVRIAPTVNGLIEMGQTLPTLERQSPNADFEIKNFNPNDEKHTNALKILQFCAKDFLLFM